MSAVSFSHKEWRGHSGHPRSWTIRVGRFRLSLYRFVGKFTLSLWWRGADREDVK